MTILFAMAWYTTCRAYLCLTFGMFLWSYWPLSLHLLLLTLWNLLCANLLLLPAHYFFHYLLISMKVIVIIILVSVIVLDLNCNLILFLITKSSVVSDNLKWFFSLETSLIEGLSTCKCGSYIILALSLTMLTDWFSWRLYLLTILDHECLFIISLLVFIY